MGFDYCYSVEFVNAEITQVEVRCGNGGKKC